MTLFRKRRRKRRRREREIYVNFGQVNVNLNFKRNYYWLGVVAHAFNSGTQEAEAVRFVSLRAASGLQSSGTA